MTEADVSPTSRVPHPHDEHLRFGWQIVQFGRRVVQRDPAKLRLVLEWIARMKPKFPGSPHLESWERLLTGQDEELRRELDDTSDFFALPAARRGAWRQLVQSQPFTCVVPGRTVRERRRAVLGRDGA